MGKKELAVTTLDLKYETFVIHIAVLSIDSSDEVYPSKKAQIAHLKADEAPTKVPSKYTYFADVFSPKLAIELLQHMKINNYTIELVDDQQPPYGPFYSLGPVELETLKTYVKNNLTNDFIKPSKFSIGAPILFDKKTKRGFTIVCGLLRSQQSDNQEPISLAIGWRIIRLISLGLTFHLAQSIQYLPLDRDLRRR